MWVYIGDGAFIPGVPARDLTDEEMPGYGEDVERSGLYRKTRKKPADPSAEDVTTEEVDGQ